MTFNNRELCVHSVHINSLTDRPQFARAVGTACFEEWPEIAAIDFGLTCVDEFIDDLSNLSKVLVAHTDNDEFVGTVSLRSTSDMPNHMPELKNWIACLFVSKEYRKNGIGSRLVRCICDVAGEMGLSVLYLSSEESNVMFYKRLGWTEKTRVEYYGQTLTVMEICLSSS